MLTLLLETGVAFALIFIHPGLVFAQEAPMSVAVSIVPQKYFVEKIGGQWVKVEVMVPPGAEMEAYEPRPGQMAALSRAKIYFALGVPFETVWLSKMESVNPQMRIVHTDKDIRKRNMDTYTQPGEVPKSDRLHAAGPLEQGSDPHIWLSPPLVMLQARAIFEALAETDPGRCAFYETNYRQFVSNLVDLDLYLSRLFVTGSKPRPFMVFHPAWGYFADAYGLQQAPVQVEGREPKAKELDQFIKNARELGSKVIFIEPQYSPKTAQTIADAIGGRLVEADDLAPDWETNLLRVAEQIRGAVNGESK
jgi:zinc transport system substrate-binding protein